MRYFRASYLPVICAKANFRNENEFSYDFDLNHVLTWNPKPQWTNGMTVEEIDYLDHFIPKVIGLPKYLHKNTNRENLYDLIVTYQMQLNAVKSLKVAQERFLVY